MCLDDLERQVGCQTRADGGLIGGRPGPRATAAHEPLGDEGRAQHALSLGGIGRGQADKLAKTIMSMETLEDVKELVALTVKT